MNTRSTAIVLSILITASVPFPAAAVTGTNEQVATAERALDRFAAAGLELPAVTIEVFDTTEPCRGNAGYATSGPTSVNGRGEYTISICTEKRYERTLIHELAHIWAADTLTDADRSKYVEFRGTESWNEGEWHEQASEHAAENITWALLDGDVWIHSAISMQDDASLTAGYEILTAAGR